MVALDILFEVKQEAILVLHLKNVILRIRKMGSGILRVLNIVFELSARALESIQTFVFLFGVRCLKDLLEMLLSVCSPPMQ